MKLSPVLVGDIWLEITWKKNKLIIGDIEHEIGIQDIPQINIFYVDVIFYLRVCNIWFLWD